MPAGDAKLVAIRDQVYRYYFTAIDSNGQPVTGFTNPVAQRSIDGLGYAACTNTAEYEGLGDGFIEFTAIEMGGNHLHFTFTCDEGSAKASIIPAVGDDIPVKLVLCTAESIDAAAFTEAAIAALQTGLLTQAYATDQGVKIGPYTIPDDVIDVLSMSDAVFDKIAAYARDVSNADPAENSVGAEVKAAAAGGGGISLDTTVDGVSLRRIFATLLAVNAGTRPPVSADGEVVFLKQDGETPQLTLTRGESPGEITDSEIAAS